MQLRLAIRLTILFIVAAAVAAGLLVLRAYATADSLEDRELSERARDLGRSVTIDGAGKPRFDLPPKLAAAYAAGADTDIYAIRTPDGQVIAASPTSVWRTRCDLARADRRSELFPATGRQRSFAALLRPQSRGGQRRRAALDNCRARGGRQFIHRFSVVGIRHRHRLDHPALRGDHVGNRISGNSRRAQASHGNFEDGGGDRPGDDLPSGCRKDDLPSEIAPLVTAVNRALDRLEQGFAVQRQFTANAAHELRTPLAIVTGALDAMEGNGELAKLKADVARMNRLVEQLLRVARLDAIAIDISEPVDLNEVAAEVVAGMAPWAIAQASAARLSRS